VQQPNPSPERISVLCPACQARLRAPRQLLGRTSPCPRCKEQVLVRLPIPSDADISLVAEGPGPSV
jgi:hypothetical protein